MCSMCNFCKVRIRQVILPLRVLHSYTVTPRGMLKYCRSLSCGRFISCSPRLPGQLPFMRILWEYRQRRTRLGSTHVAPMHADSLFSTIYTVACGHWQGKLAFPFLPVPFNQSADCRRFAGCRLWFAPRPCFLTATLLHYYNRIIHLYKVRQVVGLKSIFTTGRARARVCVAVEWGRDINNLKTTSECAFWA